LLYTGKITDGCQKCLHTTARKHNKKLKQIVENFTEMILILQKARFGSSSEKTPKNYIQGQLSLFNEAEVYSVSTEADLITKEVKSYTRTNTKQKE